MRVWMGWMMAAAVLVAGCEGKVNPRVATTPNQTAELKGDLPVNPLNWQVITSEFNTREQTMATLFGNDAAVAYARTHAEGTYPAGAEIALVTWTQQEDARWFGARIPSTPKSVELVTATAGADGKPVYAYHAYEGAPLKLARQGDAARMSYLLAERAAVMP